MITRISTRFLLAVVLALVLTGCGASEPVPETEEPIKELSAGEQVFQSKCRRCHKIDGVGGNKGPNLSKIGAKRDAEFFDKWLSDPKSVKKTAKMPNPKLTDEQRADIIEYLETLK